MRPDAPVGVFDSGVGGLSVLREIRARLPGESLLYIADSGHVPYGERSTEFVQQRCRAMTDFLLVQGAKALVVACNTATAAAVAELRTSYPQLPIIGMEPAVKPAAAATRNGVVGVLATTGTLKSARFAALLDRFASNVQVVTQPCPGLVEYVERGDLASGHTRAVLAGFVQPLLSAGCDTIILGCTHYPFLRPLLVSMVPEGVQVIDTGAAVARQLERQLRDSGLLAPEGTGPQPVSFWSSGDPQRMSAVLPVLWGAAHEVQVLPV